MQGRGAGINTEKKKTVDSLRKKIMEKKKKFKNEERKKNEYRICQDKKHKTKNILRMIKNVIMLKKDSSD